MSQGVFQSTSKSFQLPFTFYSANTHTAQSFCGHVTHFEIVEMEQCMFLMIDHYFLSGTGKVFLLRDKFKCSGNIYALCFVNLVLLCYVHKAILFREQHEKIFFTLHDCFVNTSSLKGLRLYPQCLLKVCIGSRYTKILV